MENSTFSERGENGLLSSSRARVGMVVAAILFLGAITNPTRDDVSDALSDRIMSGAQTTQAQQTGADFLSSEISPEVAKALRRNNCLFYSVYTFSDPTVRGLMRVIAREKSGGFVDNIAFMGIAEQTVPFAFSGSRIGCLSVWWALSKFGYYKFFMNSVETTDDSISNQRSISVRQFETHYPWEKTNNYTLYRLPGLKQNFVKAFGQKLWDQWISYSTSNPIEGIDDPELGHMTVVETCMPHFCPMNDVVFLNAQGRFIGGCFGDVEFHGDKEVDTAQWIIGYSKTLISGAECYADKGASGEVAKLKSVKASNGGQP
jgi:hypothetical protein